LPFLRVGVDSIRFALGYFRRRLGSWSIAWLLCQVASISAFMPATCCAAHEVHGEADECQEGTPADQCPMRNADGTVCPMHQAMASAASVHAGHAGHGGHDASPAADAVPADCRLSGLCEGPSMALSTLFSVPGILPADSSAAPLTPVDAPRAVARHFTTTVVSHDPPPPKA
jgi:hypothetical protein